MNPIDREKIVTKNVEEVITLPELRDVLKKRKPRCYIGYETSGPVHIGHLLSIRKLLDMTEAKFDVTVLWADIHTLLNRKGSETWIAEVQTYWETVFRAMGVKAHFVIGSSFELENEYVMNLLRLAGKTKLARGTRAMQGVSRGKEDTTVSQMIYPLMQSLDIAALKLDVAIGGMEQRKIHMLARELLPGLGYKKPVCLHHPLVLSLLGGTKMSSSDPKTMFPLHASEKTIKKAINGAYCPATEANGNPIIQMAEFFLFGKKGWTLEREDKYGGDITFETPEDLKNQYMDKKVHPADLKLAVITQIVKHLAPVRQAKEENPKVFEVVEK